MRIFESRLWCGVAFQSEVNTHRRCLVTNHRWEITSSAFKSRKAMIPHVLLALIVDAAGTRSV